MTWYFVDQQQRTVSLAPPPAPAPEIIAIRMPFSAPAGRTIDIEVDLENYGDAGWVGVAWSPIEPPMLEAVDTYFEMAEGATYTARLSYTMPNADMVGYVAVYYWLDGVPPYGPVTGPTEAVRLPRGVMRRVSLRRLAAALAAPSASEIASMIPYAIPVVFIGGAVLSQLAPGY